MSTTDVRVAKALANDLESNLELSGRKNDRAKDDEDFNRRKRNEKSVCLLVAILKMAGIYERWDRVVVASKGFLVMAYHVYLALAVYYNVTKGEDWGWCEGVGFVVATTVCVYIGILWKLISKAFCGSLRFQRSIQKISDSLSKSRSAKLALYLVTISVVSIFLIVDTWSDQRRLISAGGIVVLVGFGVLFSKHPKEINWRQVTWGLVLQFILALIILRWPTGKSVIDCIGSKIEKFLLFTDSGSGFVFGYLVHRRPFLPQLLEKNSMAYNVTMAINENKASPPVVVFKALSVIYFFSFIVNILFYYGIIQRITQSLGRFLRLTVGTTACESLNAASNIFLGQAMAPLLIKPYIGLLTMSEVHAVMTSGFATIAGTVMAAYISFGVSSAHLLSASVMSAPAALAFAKLLYPETENSQTSDQDIKLTRDHQKNRDANLLTAAVKGASEAALLVINITSIVVAFIAFVAFLNSIFSFFGGLVGFEHFTFEFLLTKLFTPVAFILGIDWEECDDVGRLIGIKTVLNEFIAYRELGLLKASQSLSPRSIAITTYALCGFANPGSVGVQLAVLGSLCPKKKSSFSKIIMRAFVAGLAACFLTACVAGALITEDGIEALQK